MNSEEINFIFVYVRFHTQPIVLLCILSNFI